MAAETCNACVCMAQMTQHKARHACCAILKQPEATAFVLHRKRLTSKYDSIVDILGEVGRQVQGGTTPILATACEWEMKKRLHESQEVGDSFSLRQVQEQADIRQNILKVTCTADKCHILGSCSCTNFRA